MRENGGLKLNCISFIIYFSNVSSRHFPLLSPRFQQRRHAAVCSHSCESLAFSFQYQKLKISWVFVHHFNQIFNLLRVTRGASSSQHSLKHLLVLLPEKRHVWWKQGLMLQWQNQEDVQGTSGSNRLPAIISFPIFYTESVIKAAPGNSFILYD